MWLSSPTLLLIDVQVGFDDPRWGKRNNPRAEQNIARLLSFWRERSMPVVHIQHVSTEPGSPLRADSDGSAIKLSARPMNSEPVFAKCVNSAFIGTALEQTLRERGTTSLVVAGLTTDHCVSTSVRMGSNLGFEMFVVSDATATFDRTGPDGKHYTAETIHETALASLHGEFATVLTTEEILLHS